MWAPFFFINKSWHSITSQHFVGNAWLGCGWLLIPGLAIRNVYRYMGSQGWS